MANLKWIASSTALLFYACATMYLLLDVQPKKLSAKRNIAGILFFLGFLIFNILAQVLLGYQHYGRYYLLLTQLPVYVLFMIVSKYRGIKLLFVLLTTVFFSSPVMTLISVLRYFFVPPVWIYLLCYLFFILLIYKFFKKPFNQMLAFADNQIFLLFTTVPLLYYVYSYSLTQYQIADIIISKRYFILQLPQLIVLVAYLLLVLIFKMVSEKADLTNAQNLASAQLGAATKQIEQLKVADKNFAIYRHDLRHHLNYLNACISENKLEEAAVYIKQTFYDLDNMKLVQYSPNEPVNLILSAYVSKAREKGIAIEVNISASNFGRFHITDLCSLLANALENAINACTDVPNHEARYIQLRMYEKSNKLCLHIANSYAMEPIFEQGVPVSHSKGHGIGVKSMIHVIDKYEGVYRFSANRGVFTFQVSM